MTSSTRRAPAPLPEFDPSTIVDLDVRDDLRAGREPLARILGAVESLRSGSVLHLRTPFQPVPLFDVLGSRGFQFHSEAFADDDWSSWFWRDAVAVRPPAAAPDASPVPAGIWDLRKLPPPEPLGRLLERIAGNGTEFEVLLPAYSDLLAGVLSVQGWQAVLVAVLPDGAWVRITPTPRAG